MNGVVTLPVSGERAGKLQALLFYIKVKIFLKHHILHFNIKCKEFMDSLNIENTVLSLEIHLSLVISVVCYQHILQKVPIS